MSKVYIVITGNYDDTAIDSVFTDKDKAEAHLKEMVKVDDAKIEIYDTDPDYSHMAAKQYWTADIDVLTGELKPGWTSKVVDPVYAWVEKSEMGSVRFADEYPLKTTGYIPQSMNATSYVSEEHAQKLAIEAHQSLMRRIDVSKIRKIGPPGAASFSLEYPVELLNQS